MHFLGNLRKGKKPLEKKLKEVKRKSKTESKKKVFMQARS